MIRRLAQTPGLVFAIFFVWKVGLLLFTVQPVPNNDSFFYDGAVVNFLAHGKYCNPSLVNALPISGAEVFSAYPPLYQVVLLGWMAVLGNSALGAMWLHVALLGVFLLVLRAIFQRLNLPAKITNLTGLFLFGITFHDRPDTVAHVLGALAVWAALRGGRGHWLSAAALVLSFCASLQICGAYLLACAALGLIRAWSGKEKLPWWPALLGGVTLLGLVMLVRVGFPHLWAGFHEHVRITPSLTPWRWPSVLDVLKAVRTAPGVCGAAILLAWAVGQRRLNWREAASSPSSALAVSITITALAIVAASLTMLSPNTIQIVNYLQPLAVGALLGAGIITPAGRQPSGAVSSLFLCLAFVTAVRAIGMSTWGVACARDVNYTQARDQIRAEVAGLPAGSTVISSAAYLYDLASRTNLNWIHNDWPAVPGEAGWEARAFAELKPARIILTQFDYYRRFGEVVEQLKTNANVSSLTVTNLANLRPPDAFPKMQRVVQHVSWAPVIVELQWR